MNILIVEDDRNICSFLEQAFDDEGYIVDTAHDGKIGLQKAKMNQYDVIVLDYHIPSKNGKEICTELRQCNSTTRIIILTVKTDIGAKVELLNCGADDYMTKPFVFGELLARTRALLRRPDPLRENVIAVGPISLDASRHIVMNNGTEIVLTPKEFSLLEYLMHNHGHILSRMNILEHVWGVNADPFTNTIETHVLNLRKKLGDKDSKILIHTVAGVGYKMA